MFYMDAGGNGLVPSFWWFFLCRTNVSPKTAQTLARHSDIRLTMNTYSHVGQQEQAAAISRPLDWAVRSASIRTQESEMQTLDFEILVLSEEY